MQLLKLLPSNQDYIQSGISLYRLKACDVAYIGLREVDPEETQIIQDLDMQAFSMRDVDELGIREVKMQFIQT